MKISIYELMGLIKDNKAPKKIKYGDTYTLNKEKDDYENKQTCIFLYNLFSNSKSTNDFLKKEIEILEENDEWEDIVEYNIEYEKNAEKIKGQIFLKYNNESGKHIYTITSREKIIFETLNQLIKNQKYLKEKVDKNG